MRLLFVFTFLLLLLACGDDDLVFGNKSCMEYNATHAIINSFENHMLLREKLIENSEFKTLELVDTALIILSEGIYDEMKRNNSYFPYKPKKLLKWLEESNEVRPLYNPQGKKLILLSKVTSK